jgi:hypothetical protein
MATPLDPREIERLVRHELTTALWMERLEFAVEAVVSLALRELLTVVLVDCFRLTCDAACRLRISMIFRSPLCCNELATAADPHDMEIGLEIGAESLVENQVALAVSDFLGAAWMADVRIAVNRQDHLVCSFTVHAPAPLDEPPGGWNYHSKRRKVNESFALDSRPQMNL